MARYGLNESRRLGVVIKRGTDTTDAEIQTLLEIHENGAIPNLVFQFFASDELTRLRREQS
jgi:hypothetical protein